MISKSIIQGRIAYYKVDILTTFKGKDKIEKAIKVKKPNSSCSGNSICVKSRLSSSTCGVSLRSGTEYLLIGWIEDNELNYDYCSLGGIWKYMDKETIDNVNGGYDCNCPVVSCIGDYCLNGVSEDKVHCKVISKSWSTMFGKSSGCTCKRVGVKCVWSSQSC